MQAAPSAGHDASESATAATRRENLSHLMMGACFRCAGGFLEHRARVAKITRAVGRGLGALREAFSGSAGLERPPRPEGGTTRGRPQSSASVGTP